jgi:hypothetical protein
MKTQILSADSKFNLINEIQNWLYLPENISINLISIVFSYDEDRIHPFKHMCCICFED